MISPERIAEITALTASADRRTWFCERGDFWGTVKQLLLCARCGGHEIKRGDKPRHYAGIFTPKVHMVCDECFDTLPDDEPAAQATSSGGA